MKVALYRRIAIVISLIVFCIPLSSHAEEADLATQAAEQYQNSDWVSAAASYRKLTEQQASNYFAWYRLANSLIELRQGTQALSALDMAAKGTAIPAAQIAYQYAQAYKLSDNSDLAWKKLAESVDSGYSNEQTMAEAKIWAEWRDQEKFKALSLRVAKNAHPCVHDERFTKFDFWLGDWSVYGNLEKSGPLFGNNKIEKTQDGCLVMEYWTSARGTTGTSMNYYDGTKDKWVQHWMSMGGTTINIEGDVIDGSMKLAGNIYYLNSQEPKVRDFRALWTPLEKGVVRQFFEESVDGGETWYTWFEGFYFPDTSL